MPGGSGYANVEIMIIEQVEIGNVEKISEREVYWQQQLRCYVENGETSTVIEGLGVVIFA